MKLIFVLIIALTHIPILAFSQASLPIGFEKGKDTIKVNSPDNFYIAKILIPKQTSYLKYKVLFSIDTEKTNVQDILVPNNLTFDVKDNTKDTTILFKVSFKREIYNDRILIFNVTAQDSNGNTIKLVNANATEEVYIKPFGKLEYTNNEYWFFVGTNIDLLDGVKAKELYFKGAFLIPINEKKLKNYVYMTFEKNRFFSTKDSLYDVSFSKLIYPPDRNDSITIIKGRYSSYRETVTENIGYSINYLWNIKNSNFYVMGGVYYELQNKTSYYKNYGIHSDTTTYLRIVDSTYRYSPMLTKFQWQERNNNFYLGFMYIYAGNSLNFKTYVQSGINYFCYPISWRTSSTTNSQKNKTTTNLYIRYHFDVTLIESPGISFGGEVYYRKGEMPLFNFTFSKVFDYRQIKNLFSSIQP